MKKLVTIIVVLCTAFLNAQNKSIKPYVTFLNNTPQHSAKEYILQQFKDHDIVVLCERDHRDLSQYQLIKEILEDKYFTNHVKNLFTEVGIVNLNPEINEFLQTDGLDSITVNKKILAFQQNASFWAIWEKYNYHFLLQTLYNINNHASHKIAYYPSDVEFHWDAIKNSTDYTQALDIDTEPRDSLIAQNIIKTYERFKTADNKKALIILNYRHAFKQFTYRHEEPFKNATKYLYDYFGDNITNILINQTIFKATDTGYNFALIQDGKWDAAFAYNQLESTGFDIQGSPFGNDQLDMWNTTTTLTYADVFDGFVFYLPIEKFQLVSGVPNLITEDFKTEFLRRSAIYFAYAENPEMLEKLKDEHFQKLFIKDINNKRTTRYPNLQELIDIRERYLQTK